MPRTTNLSASTPGNLAEMQAGPDTPPGIHRRSLSSPITSTSIPDRFDAPGTKVPGSHPDTNELKSARDAHRLDCLASDRVSRTHPRCDCAHRDQSTSGSAHHFMPTARVVPADSNGDCGHAATSSSRSPRSAAHRPGISRISVSVTHPARTRTGSGSASSRTNPTPAPVEGSEEIQHHPPGPRSADPAQQRAEPVRQGLRTSGHDGPGLARDQPDGHTVGVTDQGGANGAADSVSVAGLTLGDIPPRAGPHATRDTTKVGSHDRQTGSWLRRLP
jgi:hypothetical protein